MRPVSSPLRTRYGEQGSGGPSPTTVHPMPAHSTARPTLFQRWFGQGTPEPRQPASFESFEVSSASWTDAETPGERSRGLEPRTAVAVILAAVLLVPTALSVPGRHLALDATHETDARRWVDGALDGMAEDAVVVSWWSYSTPLWYAQRVEGRRPDITIVDDRTRLDEDLGDFTDVIDANLPSRPVYVIREDPKEIDLLADRYIVEPVPGLDSPYVLMRVIGRRETAA